MVKIAGKYVLVENKNYYEMLLRRGYTEEKAKQANDFKSTIEVEVDGNKIRVSSVNDPSASNKNATDFILNQVVTEKSPTGSDLKSTMTQDGNVVTIKSIQADGTPGMQRIATFSDTGLELKILASKEGLPATIRIFKRSS